MKIVFIKEINGNQVSHTEEFDIENIPEFINRIKQVLKEPMPESRKELHKNSRYFLEYIAGKGKFTVHDLRVYFNRDLKSCNRIIEYFERNKFINKAGVDQDGKIHRTIYELNEDGKKFYELVKLFN